MARIATAPDSPAGLGERAFYAFTLALAAGPLDRLVYEHQLPSVARAAAWGMVYLGFALLLQRRPRSMLAAYRRVWPLLLMPAYALASVIWSVRPAQSAVGALELAAAIVFGAALGCRVDERRLLALVVAVLGILAVADMAATLFSPEGLDINGEAVGIFSHKNANGGMMATTALAATAVVVFGGGRLVALPVAAIAVVALGMSGSRTSWVAAIAGLLTILAMLARRLRPPARPVALLLGVAGLCALGLGVLGSGVDVVRLFFAATGKDTTLTGRTDLWYLAWGFIHGAPVLGHGFDAFWTNDPTSDAAFVNEVVQDHLKSFHNGLLEAAVDLGWVGTGLQLALMAAFLGPVARLARRGDPAAAAFAAALLVQVAFTNLSEVALFVRHGFDLLLLSALWSRAQVPAPRPAGRRRKPPAPPGCGEAGGPEAGDGWGTVRPLPALPGSDQGQPQ